jgi:hypothetical protein
MNAASNLEKANAAFEQQLGAAASIDFVKHRRDLEDKKKKLIACINNTFPTDLKLLYRKDLMQLWPLARLSKAEKFNAKWRFLVLFIFVIGHMYSFRVRHMKFMSIPYLPLSLSWSNIKVSGLGHSLLICAVIVTTLFMATKAYSAKFATEIEDNQKKIDEIPLIIEKTKNDMRKDLEAAQFSNIVHTSTGTPIYEVASREPIRQKKNPTSSHLGTDLFIPPK